MITDEGLPNVTRRIDIDRSEWEAAYRLLGMTSPAEDRAMGHIRLATRNGRRYWYAADSTTLLRVEGDRDPEDIDILIPPRLVASAGMVALLSTDTALFLCEREDGSPFFAVRGDAGEMLAPRSYWRFPDVDNVFDEGFDRAIDVEVEASRLRNAIAAADYGYEIEDPSSNGAAEEILLVRSSDSLWLRAKWEKFEPVTVSIAVEPGPREFSAVADPAVLYKLLRRFEGTIGIAFGDDPNDPILFRGEEADAIIKPERSGAERLRSNVETVIREVFGWDALSRDEDGDYRLKPVGVPVWARLENDDPVTLRVFATVAAEIANSPELLSEINDLNATLTFAKVHWSDDIVTVSSDLVAETVDAAELFTAFARVNGIGENMSDVIVAMFGGRGLNRDEQRWQNYLETDIYAEIFPFESPYLTGASAIEDWPFEQPVFVITAHNPYNIEKSPQQNDEANIALGMELARLNGRYCAAVGTSRVGDHSEDSFLVWNLDFDQLIWLAEKFRQEAIFVLTADEVRLINVRTEETVATAPRRD